MPKLPKGADISAWLIGLESPCAHLSPCVSLYNVKHCVQGGAQGSWTYSVAYNMPWNLSWVYSENQFWQPGKKGGK